MQGNGRHKYHKDSSARKRSSSGMKQASQHCSAASSQRRSFEPETSHLQQLTKTDYRQKMLFLNRYLDDVERFAVLDRTLLPQSPVYSNFESVAGSANRRLALQTENNYFVQKINQLQADVAAKNRTISLLENTSKGIELQRQQFESEKISMKKMISLLNRQNAVLKKALNLVPADPARNKTQSSTISTKDCKENYCCNQPDYEAPKEDRRLREVRNLRGVRSRHVQTAS